MPPDYNPGPDPSNWYWSLQYGLTNATGTDTITIGVGSPASPVRLVVG